MEVLWHSCFLGPQRLEICVCHSHPRVHPQIPGRSKDKQKWKIGLHVSRVGARDFSGHREILEDVEWSFSRMERIS